ncbi:MAG: radical SAM protein [Clostridiales bacterium]|nr:radical SAM protein [Clostridiales bacterium]
MSRVKRYERENWNTILHTTWNPDGPGVIRIHLVPPKYMRFRIKDSLVILNGQDILPINESWAILLSEYIKSVNEFGDGPMTEEELDGIIEKTISNVRKVYPRAEEKILLQDLDCMISIFEDIVEGREIQSNRKPITLGEYAPYMSAPHRIDLMVSAMKKDGHWNCNQQCIHCYAAEQEHAEEQELSTGDWLKIIDTLRKEKISQVTFTGGEPTMRDDLPEIIRHARWFVTRLNTNGVRLTPEFCRALKEADLDSVQITFYSSDREVHDKLVGTPNFDKTVAGIRNALEAGLNLSINTPLCKTNRNYRETLAFLKELGVRYVTCSGLIQTGNAKEAPSQDLILSEAELYDVLKDATEYVYANKMEISFTSPGWIPEEKLREMGLEVPSCGACLSNMAITPSGNVVPCQSWLSDDVLGNILTDKWKKIWESDRCRKIRAVSAKMEQKCQLRKEQ